MAANNMLFSYNQMNKSINALSTGLRIASAADDAAGLAVREIFRSQVAVMAQGIRNVNDAISMLQTMDGAASVIDEKLIRMKELAEQAATGTYTASQRAIMQAEFNAMRDEITRIANATQFNEVFMLNCATSFGFAGNATEAQISAAQGVKIHFGIGNSSSADYYGIQRVDITASGLSVRDSDGANVSTQASAQATLEIIADAILLKDSARAHFGAMQNRLENTARQLTIQRENINAAESRISDIDVALEMTNFVNLQIKTQAAVAMLAQANMVPQMALQLLGG